MSAQIKKSKLEKMVEKLPIEKHCGRQTIYPKLSYSFKDNVYYYYTGKKENKSGKLTATYYSTKDPIEMEKFVTDFEKLSTKKSKEHSALHTRETVEEYLNNFIQNRRYVQPATEIYYNQCKKRICKILGKYELFELTTTDCDNYITAQLEKYSGATVRKDYDFLMMSLRKAERSRKIPFNPLEEVTPPNKSKEDLTQEIKYYSAEDATKIITECTKIAYQNKDNKYHNEDPNNLYVWAILIAIYTGMRREEVCGLKFECVHINNEEIPYIEIIRARTDTCNGYQTLEYETKETKNKSSKRNVVIPDELVPILQYITDLYSINKANNPNFVDSQFVISFSNGTIPYPRTVTTQHKKILKTFKLSEVLDFKALRHTFATLSRDGGDVTPFDLQNAMGHASISTTEKYYLGKTKIIKTGALKSFQKMISKDE